jgi:hypothetical protein
MAKSLDPNDISVTSGQGSAVSPFDCSRGPDDDNDYFPGNSLNDGLDDYDYPSGC